MTLLFRYLIFNNAMILLPTLGVGIGLYLLTDLFERLDNFIEAGLSAKTVCFYFLVKMPLVISQILPVIFLLSTVIQLSLMARSRELMALQTGGISLGIVARAMLLCGVFWGCTQLLFSEYLGVTGEREASRIWQEEVRKKNLAATVLSNLWFADGEWIISIDTLRPDNTGTGFTGYKLSENGKHIEMLLHATEFFAEANHWVVKGAVTNEPANFVRREEMEIVLPLKQNPANFRLLRIGDKPTGLPIWLLKDAIQHLQASGSNVELLKTTLHAKIAYAASIFIMAIVATAIISWKENIYLAVPISLVCTFLYYALYTLGRSLGERGLVDPIIAAWSANLIAFTLALWRMLYVLFARKFR